MKKPNTYIELIELVNPLDLDEVLGFSGKNDKFKDKGIKDSHYELRRKYSIRLFNTIKYETTKEISIHNWKTPRNMQTNNDFYETLLKCIQDYYWWSHEFHHVHAPIYKRVVHALEIKIEEINIHTIK